MERAVALWSSTGGRNMTDHATFQITLGQHQEVRHEWIGQVLEMHYALDYKLRGTVHLPPVGQKSLMPEKCLRWWSTPREPWSPLTSIEDKLVNCFEIE